MILTDQHRYDCLGCNGNNIIETPYIDWIAAEGTNFRNAYSMTPSCVPARASLITGMNQWNTGILGMGAGQGRMGVGFEHTLPGELSKNGYHTQAVGKMHFFPQRSLNGFHKTVLDEAEGVDDPGFVSDYMRWFEENKTADYDTVEHGVDANSWMARPYHLPEYLHPNCWTANEAIRFIKEKDPGMPFFLKMSFLRPHSPYDALPYYFDLYMKKQIPMPVVGQWAGMHDVPEDAARPDAWRGVRREEEIFRARASYYGSINHIDMQIGRVLMYLRRIGQLDNTMLLFMSDHGDMLGDHNLWRKTYAYEGSAHIPMIISLPKSMRGSCDKKIVSEPVTHYDVMPTILDAAGIAIPGTVDGKSMMKLIRGENTGWREYVHGEHSACYSEESEMQYVTDGKVKYIWFPRLGTEQLFNLENDRNECIDLAQDSGYAEVLPHWRKRLIKELEPRNLGITDGDNLICQKGKPPMVSPKYLERKKRAGFDWDKYHQPKPGFASNQFNRVYI